MPQEPTIFGDRPTEKRVEIGNACASFIIDNWKIWQLAKQREKVTLMWV